MKFSLNKSSCRGCKWSSLNAPSIESPWCHSILKLGEFHFSHYWLSNKNLPPPRVNEMCICTAAMSKIWRRGSVNLHSCEVCLSLPGTFDDSCVAGSLEGSSCFCYWQADKLHKKKEVRAGEIITPQPAESCSRQKNAIISHYIMITEHWESHFSRSLYIS